LLSYFAPVLSPSDGVLDSISPSGHSRGQQALLRAFAGSPKLIVLDEVFWGMNEQIAMLLTRYLREELTPQHSKLSYSFGKMKFPGEVPSFGAYAWAAKDSV